MISATPAKAPRPETTSEMHGGNEFAGADDCKGRAVVTALEIEQFVFGVVGRSDLVSG